MAKIGVWNADPRWLPEVVQLISSGAGYYGAPEYTPRGVSDQRELPQRKGVTYMPRVVPRPYVRSPEAADVRVTRWDSGQREVLVNSTGSTVLVLNLYAYPGWRATVNGNPRAIEVQPGTGLVQLSLGAGRQAITLRFESTSDRTGGWLLSLICWGLVVLYLAQPANRNQATEEVERMGQKLGVQTSWIRA